MNVPAFLRFNFRTVVHDVAQHVEDPAQGFPANLTHGLGCGATMLVFSKPLLEKLDRLKRKYGMLEV